MYNIRNRLNVIASLTMMILGIGAVLMGGTSILLSYVDPPTPTAVIEALVHPMLFRARAGFTGRLVDRAMIRVNGTADFSSCFDWNTKQVYVYAVVEYQSNKYSRNEITVYDVIVQSKEEAKNVVFDKVIEYPADDIEHSSLAGLKGTLKLKYHIMSYSGISPLLEVGGTGTAQFTFPAAYATH